MNESLRQQWRSSTKCLVDQLNSKLQESESKSLPPLSNDATTEAISTVCSQWLEKVEFLYSEPHRAYHNMSHVEDVLASLDSLLGTPNNKKMTVDRATMTLAAFFHDVIYNPKSSTNEKDSADLFVEFASDLSKAITLSVKKDHTGQSINSIASSMVSEVEQCIIATATHTASANEARQTNNTLMAAFLDADMSILGSDSERYDKYAGSIRKEYEFVERSVYCQKRADILESFLPADAVETTEEESPESREGGEKQHSYIYATEKGRNLWEDRARQNLRREIDMLRSGVIPCENEMQ